MPGASDLLQMYDDQLRGGAEVRDAETVERLGPLWLATWAGGRGFITVRPADVPPGTDLAALVPAALEHVRADPRLASVEWKTRGHDVAPGLAAALVAAGFVPEDPESIMIGEARLLDVEVPLPAGVTLRRVSAPEDVRDEGTEQWVAEVDGEVVSAGRLEPVPGTAFAGLWGGATVPAWRHRGIYRALTAARARSALAMGKALMTSDSTEYSRPILERCGLVRVGTTTPYVWVRADG